MMNGRRGLRRAGRPDPAHRAGVAGARRPSTATGLAARLPVSRQAVGKHLAVLERAGLVRARRVGRESRYEPRTAALTGTASWLTVLAAEWDDRPG